MNFLEIVLQGYFNQNNREFLGRYFFREFKKAEKEQFFEANEFFIGCLKVIDGWKEYLQNEVNKIKNELYSMLNAAKSGTLSYAEMKDKTIEQLNEETIQYCIEELKNERADGLGSVTFSVHLNSLTKGRFNHHLNYNEVLQIEFAILEAFKKAIELLPPQPIEKQKSKLTINQIALKYAYEGLQITRENGNEIIKQYGLTSGEKLFQRFTYYTSIANRKGKPIGCTPKKLRIKIKLIESVIELLPIEKQQRAIDEVSILEKIYEAEYQ
jgi:PBP1b-binding outer membrane lipoprotein LpoB